MWRSRRARWVWCAGKRTDLHTRTHTHARKHNCSPHMLTAPIYTRAHTRTRASARHMLTTNPHHTCSPRMHSTHAHPPHMLHTLAHTHMRTHACTPMHTHMRTHTCTPHMHTQMHTTHGPHHHTTNAHHACSPRMHSTHAHHTCSPHMHTHACTHMHAHTCMLTTPNERARRTWPGGNLQRRGDWQNHAHTSSRTPARRAAERVGLFACVCGLNFTIADY